MKSGGPWRADMMTWAARRRSTRQDLFLRLEPGEGVRTIAEPFGRGSGLGRVHGDGNAPGPQQPVGRPRGVQVVVEHAPGGGQPAGLALPGAGLLGGCGWSPGPGSRDCRAAAAGPAPRPARCPAPPASACPPAGSGTSLPAHPGSPEPARPARPGHRGSPGPPRPAASGFPTGENREGSHTAARRGTHRPPGGPSAPPARSCRSRRCRRSPRSPPSGPPDRPPRAARPARSAAPPGPRNAATPAGS